MNAADLHTLTGAYALHALEPGEAAAFEEHLRDCPSCAQEVAELTATAARLGRAVALTPPPAMKEQVMRRITTERQLPPRVSLSARGDRPATRRVRAVPRLVLAACVAAAAGLGGVAVWQHQEAQDARGRAESAQRETRDIASVLTARDAKTVSGTLHEGGTGTVVVSRTLRRAAFLASGLPALRDGRVYELWFDDGGHMRPAGLLHPRGGADEVLLAGEVRAASGMGVTVEPAGGSTSPTTAPLALMNFPRA